MAAISFQMANLFHHCSTVAVRDGDSVDWAGGHDPKKSGTLSLVARWIALAIA
jgi:hypothetical protein